MRQVPTGTSRRVRRAGRPASGGPVPETRTPRKKSRKATRHHLPDFLRAPFREEKEALDSWRPSVARGHGKRPDTATRPVARGKVSGDINALYRTLVHSPLERLIEQTRRYDTRCPPVHTDPDVIVIHSRPPGMSHERIEPRDKIHPVCQKGLRVRLDGVTRFRDGTRSSPAHEPLTRGESARHLLDGVTFSQLMVFTGSRSEPWWVQTLSWRPRGWFPEAALFSSAFTQEPLAAHPREISNRSRVNCSAIPLCARLPLPPAKTERDHNRTQRSRSKENPPPKGLFSPLLRTSTRGEIPGRRTCVTGDFRAEGGSLSM